MALSLASAGSLALIVGLWNYESFRYRGQVHIPQSTQGLQYEFRADGTDRLYWSLEQYDYFCEREGRFQWQSDVLTDEVIRVNPRSHDSCSSDPDMQVGRKTETPVRIEQELLILTLQLGEEKIELQFRRQPVPAQKIPPESHSPEYPAWALR